jgi:hypothetical protein
VILMQKHKEAVVAVWGVALILGAAGIGAVVIRAEAQRSASKKMTSIGGEKLCVTEGTVGRGSGEEITVDVTKMRAFVTEETAQSVEARFTYLGETAETSALGSGAIRQQFGLKLRAQDACNLVYAMWRFSPKNEVVVSVKSNPGMDQSSQCGNKGYTNIKASRSSPAPPVTKGSRHVLFAEMDGQRMTVTADGRVVWEGSVGAGAMGLDGPVGIRADNVRIGVELFAGQASGGRAGTMPACKAYSE